MSSSQIMKSRLILYRVGKGKKNYGFLNGLNLKKLVLCVCVCVFTKVNRFCNKISLNKLYLVITAHINIMIIIY